MGVHQLWEIVGPTARPVRLEALRNKRLAVDASIWVYQFLKAVRDTEGNQLRNSHIVGFFRRICRLLYFGIKPVFVFDGGVPALKKQTIRKRKEKREGNKESVQQTAQKILSKQLQDYAEGKLSSSKIKVNGTNIQSKSSATRRDIPTEELYFDTYYDDLVADNADDQSSTTVYNPESQGESRMFYKQDDYDLPTLKNGIEVNESDNRLMTDYEYDRLTKDIYDDLENVDLDNVDPQSAEFAKLPLSTQYIVLSHLRLRSRLRMGYTKSQLQELFSDPMEFSKFQIKMVQKRNYFTQRVMNVTGMDSDTNEDIINRRIASDKNRAYNLKRTGDGYALSIPKISENAEAPKDDILKNEDVKLQKTVLTVDDIYDDNEEEEEYHDVDWSVVEIANGKTTETKKETDNTTLFIKDSENESSDEEFDNIEMEEVPLNKIEDENDGDEIMAQIKYLYDYSDKHNKKDKPDVSNNEKRTKVVLQDGDIDEYHEMQVQKFEEEELREAIEKSKKDYMNLLRDEKNGTEQNSKRGTNAPIILSNSSLAKALKLSNLSMNNNLLFGGKSKSVEKSSTSRQPIFEPEVVEDTLPGKPEEPGKVETANKILPLPNWFSNSNSVGSQRMETHVNQQQTNQTEDEKAGLISYSEAQDYVSCDEGSVIDIDDDSDIEFIEVTSSKNDEPHQTIETKDKELSSENIEPLNDGDNSTQDSMENNGAVEISSENDNEGEQLEASKGSETVIAPAVDINSVLTGDQTKVKRNAQIDDDFEFSDDDEMDLLVNMEEENQASNNFFNQIKSGDVLNSWSFQDESDLQDQLRKQKRDADEVSTNMIFEVQDLLSRFGIPFITAPMEAEAQCAELKILGLVDGIITDDSDCFLFGGDRVYKNLFNDKTFVECYQFEDIIKELGLNREKCIELAILLGSDYTEGVNGVGKVMAMEILAEFKDLNMFKTWWIDYQNGKIDESKETSIKKKVRKTLKNKDFFIHGNEFPNKMIYNAYLAPEVDHDKTQFKWGYPDLDKLRTFLKYYVGWNKEKVDEILLPVIKNLNKPQTRIEEFFQVNTIQHDRQLNMSKRIKDATEKLKGNSKKKQKR